MTKVAARVVVLTANHRTRPSITPKAEELFFRLFTFSRNYGAREMNAEDSPNVKCRYRYQRSSCRRCRSK
jgi:hypothetical protein